MSAAEHLQEAIDVGCTRDDHDHVADHRAEVAEELARFFEDRGRSLLDGGIMTAADAAQLIRQHTAGGLGKDTDGAQAPAGESTQPAPDLALPWAADMDDSDLHLFLGDLVAAAMGRWQSDPEVPDREVLAAVEKACTNWRTPGMGLRSDEDEQPAPDFFQRGRTYTRQHHGHLIQFRVEHVATPPGGSTPIAFGWRTEPCLSGWAPDEADDLDGWTDTTAGDAA